MNKPKPVQWKRRVLIGLVTLATLVGLLVATAFAYEEVAESHARNQFPAPGALVDVGGFRLHLYCAGHGSPTVILNSGLGVSSLYWTLVQNEVSGTTRVCWYDRAGYGWSDPGPKPRTSQNIAKELHTLLHNAGEREPYIFVGHSFGGYNVRVFAHAYPKEVAGLILVDSSHEDQYSRLPSKMKEADEAQRKQDLVGRVAARLALFRFKPSLRGIDKYADLFQDFPPRIVEEMKADTLQAKFMDAVLDEFAQFNGASADEVRAARDFRDLPLTVLTAAKSPEPRDLPAGMSIQEAVDFQEIWIGELQKDLAHLSTQGRQVLVENSDHMIPVRRPDVIVKAVDEMVITARRH